MILPESAESLPKNLAHDTSSEVRCGIQALVPDCCRHDSLFAGPSLFAVARPSVQLAKRWSDWLMGGTSLLVPLTMVTPTAIWTGEEMIVWGGYYLLDHFLNEGRQI